ncbi:uncharacterized protein LOC116243819 [Phasianus colchicus]|uniref:uncharacterized protein LOC116243819 n=1 Tax=Phasianus colchicus TaxID=9054 RepID=UPI00129D9E55|nr:uncharacterized protein LOC116243819 [Phasianus colchicus]
MSILVVKGILPLLLLAWPSAGLTHQCMTSVSFGSDLTLHCLPKSRDNRLVWCNTLKKMAEKGTGTHLHGENGSSNLTFTIVNEKHAGNYTCKMETSCYEDTKKKCPCKNKATGNLLCEFVVWSENKTMHVRWCPEPPSDSSEDSKACDSKSFGSMNAACTEPTTCAVSSTNFRGTENATQGMVPSSDPGISPTREPQTREGLMAIIYLYAIPGLVVVTLFFLLCMLVCLCRRNQRKAKGTLESMHAAETNQLSTPLPAPPTEDMTYAKLIFESTGAIPAASEVVYAEIKPLQKK